MAGFLVTPETGYTSDPRHNAFLRFVEALRAAEPRGSRGSDDALSEVSAIFDEAGRERVYVLMGPDAWTPPAGVERELAGLLAADIPPDAWRVIFRTEPDRAQVVTYPAEVEATVEAYLALPPAEMAAVAEDDPRARIYALAVSPGW